MPTFSFPAATFVIEGDPEAVRETGRAYGRFATTAGEAAADLRALDSGSWIGSEGDAFRARLGDIPPHLDVAHGTFAEVARALDGFAEVLASAQGRMAGVRADAEQIFSSLAGARADRLEGAWADQLSAAAGLRAQVLEAAQRAAVSIRAAGRRSPTADQGWLAEIPAGAVLGAGMILWGAGDALDTTVDWAEGRIGGREFAFRAGFAVATAFAGGLAVKFGGKVLDNLAPRVAERLRRFIDTWSRRRRHGRS